MRRTRAKDRGHPHTRTTQTDDRAFGESIEHLCLLSRSSSHTQPEWSLPRVQPSLRQELEDVRGISAPGCCCPDIRFESSPLQETSMSRCLHTEYHNSVPLCCVAPFIYFYFLRTYITRFFFILCKVLFTFFCNCVGDLIFNY